VTFVSRIKQHSAVWNNWKAGNRPGGVLYGARFAWSPGDIYRSGTLTKDQVAALMGHPDIILEAVGTDLSETDELVTDQAADLLSPALSPPALPPTQTKLSPSPPSMPRPTLPPQQAQYKRTR
jgi:hypothetical protein